MPNIGDQIRANKIGKKSNQGRSWYIYVSCKKCGKERWVRKDANNGYCASCALRSTYNGHLIYSEEERLAHRYSAGAKYRQKLKLEVLTHYSETPPKCARCGIDDMLVLCIDHINGGGKKHNKQLQEQGTTMYQWLKNNNYPEGFQVLCANCNLRKSILQERGQLWRQYL